MMTFKKFVYQSNIAIVDADFIFIPAAAIACSSARKKFLYFSCRRHLKIKKFKPFILQASAFKTAVFASPGRLLKLNVFLK
jgi:hypothetical protein